MNIYYIKHNYKISKGLTRDEKHAFDSQFCLELVNTPYSNEFLQTVRENPPKLYWGTKADSMVDKKVKSISDYPPGSSEALVVKTTAFEVLKPIIGNCGIAIPAMCSDAALTMLIVTGYVDCVDYNRSKLHYFTNSNKIMRIEKLVLRNEKLTNVNNIFHLGVPRHAQCFCTQAFVDGVNENKLTGFVFEPVEVV
jgi:hypothetical protein